MVRAMLITKSTPQPVSRKTPRGGKMKAKMNLQMSLGGESSQLQLFSFLAFLLPRWASLVWGLLPQWRQARSLGAAHRRGRAAVLSSGPGRGTNGSAVAGRE